MEQNRVFFPQAALDEWVVDESIDLKGEDLVILAEARRYKVLEAVRVVAEVSGSDDRHSIVGKVKPRSLLEELGAEILEGSMIIGENAYEVVEGWVATPVGTFEEHFSSADRAKARSARIDKSGGEPNSEEDLLSKFVHKTL